MIESRFLIDHLKKYIHTYQDLIRQATCTLVYKRFSVKGINNLVENHKELSLQLDDKAFLYLTCLI